MAHITSWDGSKTKALRKSGKKNFYTRYSNRRDKTGLEIVIPHENYLEVKGSKGTYIQPKYGHAVGNPMTAKKYAQLNQKAIKKLMRRK